MSFSKGCVLGSLVAAAATWYYFDSKIIPTQLTKINDLEQKVEELRKRNVSLIAEFEPLSRAANCWWSQREFENGFTGGYRRDSKGEGTAKNTRLVEQLKDCRRN